MSTEKFFNSRIFPHKLSKERFGKLFLKHPRISFYSVDPGEYHKNLAFDHFEVRGIQDRFELGKELSKRAKQVYMVEVRGGNIASLSGFDPRDSKSRSFVNHGRRRIIGYVLLSPEFSEDFLLDVDGRRIENMTGYSIETAKRAVRSTEMAILHIDFALFSEDIYRKELVEICKILEPGMDGFKSKALGKIPFEKFVEFIEDSYGSAIEG